MAAVADINKVIMHQILSRLPAIVAAAALPLLSLASLPAVADEEETSDASAHVLQAEIALHSMDYMQASREYLKAAEL